MLRLRKEIEDAHKARGVRSLGPVVSAVCLTFTCSAQMMAQLAAEKLRITATASELVRAAMSERCVVACVKLRRPWPQVSVHMSNLDHELALFSDEIVIRARETEAEAMAAQTARFEQAQHAMAVRCHPLPCWAFRIRV